MFEILGVVVVVVVLVVALALLRYNAEPEEEETAPAQVQPPAELPTKFISYADKVRWWNQRVKEWEAEVSKALQTAMDLSVESHKNVRLTIFNYYEMPVADGNLYEVSEGYPVTKIEFLPNTGPHDEDSANIEIDDQRRMPDDMSWYNFLPRPLHEAWAPKCKARREALVEGSLQTTCGLVSDKIASFEQYSAQLEERAAQAFTEELRELRIDAELKARKMLQVESRIRTVADEAVQRGVSWNTVAEEFVQHVIAEAERRAKDLFESSALLSAMTPERMQDGNMFSH